MGALKNPVLSCMFSLAEARGAHRALVALVAGAKLGSFEYECLHKRERAASSAVNACEVAYRESLGCVLSDASPDRLSAVGRALASGRVGV